MSSHVSAQNVLEAIRRSMVGAPPPGVSPAYIDGFFARNWDTLLEALKARLERLSNSTPTSGPTAWGGRRGLTQLTPHQVSPGRRVVVLNSMLEWVHGTVAELPGGARKVRLDSGAVAWFPSLWPEVSSPTDVPRDLIVGRLEGEDYCTLSPFDLWMRIRLLVRHSLRARRLVPGSGKSEQRKAVTLWCTFQEWLATQQRPRWLSWSGRDIRLLELWSRDAAAVDGAPEKLELDWLLQLPDRYQERYLPGDKMRAVQVGDKAGVDRPADELIVQRMTPFGVVYRREFYPYYLLEPVSTEPGLNTCMPPFEEPIRPLQLFDLLKGDGWLELTPEHLYAWIDRYLQEHRVEAHVQLLGGTGGRIRIEPIDSRYDGRYLPKEVLNHVFLYLPAMADDAIEIDLFQEEDVFDPTLPHLRRPIQIHPAFVASLARALVATAQEFDLPLNPSLRRCLAKPQAPQGEETASGGRRGAPLVYSPLHKMDPGYRGMRVVTPAGFHGRIAWSSQRNDIEARRNGSNAEKVEVFHVRLDSGREADHERLHLETARPQLIVPDVRIDGRYVEPGEVWARVSMHYLWLLDQAHAREGRRRPGREVREAREFLHAWYPAWQAWRRANPGAEVQGFDAEADARIETWLREQPTILSSTQTRIQTGNSSSSARLFAAAQRQAHVLELAT